MLVKVISYRADSKSFENEKSAGESHIEFDMSDVDYITSDGFAAIVRLMQKGVSVKLLNVNEHIKETVCLISLEEIL